MAGGEDEAVAIEPVGVLGVIPHDFLIEDMAHGGTPHGEARVSGIGLLHGIDGEEADGIHGLLHQSRVGFGEGFDCRGGRDMAGMAGSSPLPLRKRAGGGRRGGKRVDGTQSDVCTRGTTRGKIGE